MTEPEQLCSGQALPVGARVRLAQGRRNVLGAPEGARRLVECPLRRLVYPVHLQPKSILDYTGDFGVVRGDEEQSYLEALVSHGGTRAK